MLEVVAAGLVLGVWQQGRGGFVQAQCCCSTPCSSRWRWGSGVALRLNQLNQRRKPMGGPKRHLPQKSVLDEAQLLSFMDREGIKPVHARTIWRHVLKNGGVGCIADVAGTYPNLARCTHNARDQVRAVARHVVRTCSLVRVVTAAHVRGFAIRRPAPCGVWRLSECVTHHTDALVCNGVCSVAALQIQSEAAPAVPLSH